MKTPSITRPLFQRLFKTSALMLLMTVSLLSCPRLQAADKVPSDKLLPPSVYVYASFPNVTEMKKSFKASAGHELLHDESFAEFKKDVEELISEFSEKVESKLGISVKDLANVPTGEVAFAFLQTSDANPALLTFLDFGESRETVDKLIAKATDSIEKKENIKSSKEDVDGTTIYIYTKGGGDDDDDDDDDDSGKLKDQFAYFIKDTHLVVGSSPEVLKDVLARWDGKHEETFAGNEVYQHIMKRCQSEGRKSQLKWFVEPFGLIRNVMAASGQMNANVQMGMAMLPAIGITKFKAIGGSMDDGGEKYESVNRMMGYVDLPADGVLKIFECPATTMAPPKWVKSDVMSYVSVNWNVDGAFVAVQTLVDNFQGPGTFDRALDKAAENENGPQIHPKKDFADHLTGKFHYVIYPPKFEEVNLKAITSQTPNFLLAFDLKNADKVKAVIAKISNTPGFPGEVRRFKGETIYEIPIPMGANGKKMTGGLCVAKDTLMIATDVKKIESVIRGNDDKEALVDSKDYKRVASAYPEKTSIITYQNQGDQLKSYWKILKSDDMQDLLQNSPFKSIDLSKLPAFEAIRKYLVSNGGYVIPDENGFILHSFTVRKK